MPAFRGAVYLYDRTAKTVRKPDDPKMQYIETVTDGARSALNWMRDEMDTWNKGKPVGSPLYRVAWIEQVRSP